MIDTKAALEWMRDNGYDFGKTESESEPQYIGKRTISDFYEHERWLQSQAERQAQEESEERPEKDPGLIWEDYDNCGEGWELTRDERSGDIYIGVTLEGGYSCDEISLSKILNILKKEGIDYESILDN